MASSVTGVKELFANRVCLLLLGAVLEIHENGALMVEFVAASGRTQALVTLVPADVRAVADDDLVSVAGRRHARAGQGPERLRPTH